MIATPAIARLHIRVNKFVCVYGNILGGLVLIGLVLVLSLVAAAWFGFVAWNLVVSAAIMLALIWAFLVWANNEDLYLHYRRYLRAVQAGTTPPTRPTMRRTPVQTVAAVTAVTALSVAVTFPMLSVVADTVEYPCEVNAHGCPLVGQTGTDGVQDYAAVMASLTAK